MTQIFRAWRLALGVGLVVACALIWWVRAATPHTTELPRSPSAAQVTHKVTEEEIGRVVLSAEAEARLGIETARVERKSVPQARVYGGDVIVPAGQTILVAAPLAGILRAPQGGVPLAGRKVNKGDAIFHLLPLLSAEATTTFAASREDAEGQVNNARTQLEMSQLALGRAERLFRADAGSKRAVEEAKAQHDTALRLLEATESRLTILTKALSDATTGRTAPIPIEAPETGTLRNVSAMPDQNVPLGAPLFEVIDLTTVWIRVPVYVGDLPKIDLTAKAEVGNLNLRASDKTWSAVPVQAPPSANSLAATVDLYFALDNAGPNLTPGQRMGVMVPLSGSQDSLTLPWSAVIHDVQGGTWIYQRLEPRTYKRHRVLLRFATNDTAVLASGPPLNTEVVTQGAQELFGAETGFSK